MTIVQSFAKFQIDSWVWNIFLAFTELEIYVNLCEKFAVVSESEAIIKISPKV